MDPTESKTQIVLAAVGFFILSTYMSCQELKYMVRGKTVDAAFIETHVEEETNHRRTFQKRVVGYTFVDGENPRREYADVPMDWSAQGSGMLKVQYLPGEQFHSRLLGQSNRIWVLIFFMSLIAAGVGLWSLTRDDSVDDEPVNRG